MKFWCALFVLFLSANATGAELGAITRAAKSLLKPQQFPTVFNDASFATRMQVLAQGYEPWETEYDVSGQCIRGCAYSTMNIDEDLKQMQQATKNAVTELQVQGYLPNKTSTSSLQQIRDTGTGVVQKPTKTDKIKELEVSYQQPGKVQPVQPQPGKTQPGQTAETLVEQDVPLGWPVKERPQITSIFGRRTHPITGNLQNHSGVDLGVPTGTYVFSPANGRVVSVWTDNTCGRGIKVSHGRGYETVYCHLDEQLVVNGQQVMAGELIAYSGNSGRSTGPHLHYAIKKDGVYINPYELMR